MIEILRDLAKHRDLLYMMTLKEISLKYKQSIMGLMWAVLMPTVIVAAGLLVRAAMAKLTHQPIEPSQVATISVKALPWAFFVASIRFATGSLTANSNLVTKIRFPQEILPIAAILSQLCDFLVASAVLTVILVVLKVGVSVQLVWVPVLFALLLLFTTGLALLLSAANLFFRDVKYVVEVVLTFAIFFTPVLYDVSLFGEWAPVFMLNPVAPILEGLNAVIVGHVAPPLLWLFYSAIVSMSLLTGATAYFKHVEPLFAERI